MAIVLNEYEWAERMIADRNLGKKPGETLSRVAKYYLENNYSKKDTRKLLDQFLVQCNPDASLVSWSDTLDKIVRNASKYPLIQIDHVCISNQELARIEKLSEKSVRKVAFTILCVTKYWNIVSEENNNWVNTADKDIFQMANVHLSIKQQDMLYGKLIRAGIIRASKRIDNLNVQCLIVDDPDVCESDVGMIIQDYRNLGYQYLKHYGEPYVQCENCGLTMNMKDPSRRRKPQGCSGNGAGRKRKYCPTCATTVHLKQMVNAVMRSRSDNATGC